MVGFAWPAKHLSRLAGRLEDRHQTFMRPHQDATIAELVMLTFSCPSKDLVRTYLAQRVRERRPPPAPEEIRRRLGWALLMPERKLSDTGHRD